MSTTYRIGTDIGGTFTDIVLIGDDGSFAIRKVLSTPPRYERAVVEAIAELLEDERVAPGQVIQIAHATTVATNAVLERRGAKAGLITTQGFRDVLELRRMRFPDMYNLFWEKPPPLVDRCLRHEVKERIAADGSVLVPLHIPDAERALQILVEEEDVDSLAVCLLHAYANPAHEEMIGELASRRYPHLPISLSSDVLPETKEYERTSTTVLNAYLIPVVRDYLRNLESGLRRLGISAPVVVMQSSGGTMSVGAASRFPMQILESGPAAGVVGATVALQDLGYANGVTFDMGGTTAKSAMIEAGEPMHVSEYEVGAPISIASRVLKGGGYLLRVPTIDVAEIGAGGGSIVRIDDGGAMRVGPESAGSDPGPACYGRGGSDATVTDANVVLGYLNPDALLGGKLPIHLGKAEASVARIAEGIGLSVEETAFGIHVIANATMTRAIHAVSTERGRDVRDCALVVYGGNGPVHAAAIARMLGIGRVVVPTAPGVFSAAGLLCAPVEHNYSESVNLRADAGARECLRTAFDRLEGRLAAALADEGWSGREVSVERFADLHYRGQSHELRIRFQECRDGDRAMARLLRDFEEEHRRNYGHMHERDAVKIVTLRVRGRIQLAEPALPRGFRDDGAATRRQRSVYFGPDVGWLPTPVLTRKDVRAGSAGPLVIEEYDTTIVVPPQFRASASAQGDIFIEVSA